MTVSASLQPPGWRCVECATYHERDVLEEQQPWYLWRKQEMKE